MRFLIMRFLLALNAALFACTIGLHCAYGASGLLGLFASTFGMVIAALYILEDR